MADRRQILSFDALRALAAALVMSSHVRDVFLTSWRPEFGPIAWLFYILTSFGHPAVIVFFVLSGFWITKVVVERQEAGTFAWGGYLLDRLSRLWVVLLPALVLGAILDTLTFRVLHFPPPGYGAQSIPADVTSQLSPTWFAANALFLQGLYAPAFGSNGPLWSLTNEFWYYLWFPGLYLAAATRRVSVAAAFAVATAMLFRPLLPGFVCWLAGAALFLASRRYPGPKGLAGAVAWIPFLILFVLDRPTDSKLRDIALALAAVLPFWQAMGWSFSRAKPIAAYGAASSFSLYVIHFPLLVLVAAAIGMHERLKPTATTMGGCLALMVALIGVAWAFSQLTERNTRRVRAWVAALGTALMARFPKTNPV